MAFKTAKTLSILGLSTSIFPPSALYQDLGALHICYHVSSVRMFYSLKVMTLFKT